VDGGSHDQETIETRAVIVLAALLTALVSALIQAVLHWFPWRMVLARDLPRIPAYILGVLGVALPLSGLYWYWCDVSALVSLWVVIAASGSSVIGAYAIDWTLDRVRQSYEHEERNEAQTTQQ
jgi:hypothetical protein